MHAGGQPPISGKNMNEFFRYMNENDPANYDFTFTDICCIYDMRTNDAPYCPLFDTRVYYSMVNIEGVDLTNARWYALDQERLLSWSAPEKTIENNEVVLIEF